MGRGLFVRVKNESDDTINTKVTESDQVHEIDRLNGLVIEPGQTSPSKRVEATSKFIAQDSGSFTLSLRDESGEEQGFISLAVQNNGGWRVSDTSSFVKYEIRSTNDEHLLVTLVD